MATQKAQTQKTAPEEVPARAGEEEKREAVQSSGLEAAPKDQTSPTGGSFVNPASIGSGTIMADGTYGAPLPDPSVDRLKDADKSDR